MALIVEKEECLVALFVQAWNVHWTAHREPELVAVRIRFRRVANSIKERVGVELAVSQVLVHVSVQAAASRFRNYVNDVSGAPAVLRGKGMLLHLELLHVVRGGNVPDSAPSH